MSGRPGGPCTMRFKLNKFEHVWGVSLYRGGWLGGSLYGGVPVRGGLGKGFLYGEVQCIMGNGHMGLPVDRHDWKHYLPATSLVGGKMRIVVNYILRIVCEKHGLQSCDILRKVKIEFIHRDKIRMTTFIFFHFRTKRKPFL